MKLDWTTTAVQRFTAALALAMVRPLAGSIRGRSVTAEELRSGLREGEVLLTFDDGPDSPTAAVLAALRAFDAIAVFFLIGRKADAKSSVARKVGEAGQLVGTHTYQHLDIAGLPVREALDEVRRGHRAVSNAVAPAKCTALFRVPYLTHAPMLSLALHREGFFQVDVCSATLEFGVRDTWFWSSFRPLIEGS